MNLATDFPSVLTLEKAAAELGDLADDLLFVGGATIGFYLTDLGTRIHRETLDIDAVVEAATRAELASYDDRMRKLGFREDVESGVICRWRKNELIVDLMPTGEAALGFHNRWYEPAFATAVQVSLASGRRIQISEPAYALACKIEAFLDRGLGDFQASPDFEDIVALLDCRPELADEFARCDPVARSFVAEVFQNWLNSIDATQGIAAHLPPDAASQARRGLVLDRMRQIVALSSSQTP